jgi:hypothetical protein
MGKTNLRLIADCASRKLLRAQALGAGDKRIEVAAMALTASMTVDLLADAEPYGEVAWALRRCA